jgi:hypothetical protein
MGKQQKPLPGRWNVEITDEYEKWFRSLTERQQDAVRADIALLERVGPSLGRPHVDTIKQSRHPNMKELRTMSGRRHLRSFFAFDPRRTAILLIGGDKTGDRAFYVSMIPTADAIYDQYLAEISREGLIP